MINNKLNILATCQYGWPEPYPSLNVMEEMAKRGHYVQAITGNPNYPMGEFFKGYEKNKINCEYHNGVYITHVPLIPRKKDAIHRFLNYHSYPFSANKEIEKLKQEFDVVFANQSSPVMMVEPAIKYAKKWNKRVVMYCMDLWPASLCIGGIKNTSLIYKFYYLISKKIYRSVDCILVTSRMFKDYFLEEFNIDPSKIHYVPQYAVSVFDNKIETISDKDTYDIVFAGNIGKAQNIKVILSCAEIIKYEKINGKSINFHIVGDGQELESLKKYKADNELNNVIFHGRQKQEEMPKFYALADAMLVTLIDDPFISLTLPAKVQSYLAAGKPIIGCANGEIANIIKEANCGICAPANNSESLAEAVIQTLKNKDEHNYADNSRNYYIKSFSVNIVMDKLEKILYEYKK